LSIRIFGVYKEVVKKIETLWQFLSVFSSFIYKRLVKNKKDLQLMLGDIENGKE